MHGGLSRSAAVADIPGAATLIDVDVSIDRAMVEDFETCFVDFIRSNLRSVLELCFLYVLLPLQPCVQRFITECRRGKFAKNAVTTENS